MYGLGAPVGQVRPVVKDPGGLQIIGRAGYGNTDNPGLDAGTIATVGNGTILNNSIEGQIIYRTGPTAAYTDTFDTAAHLDAGIGGGMDPGDCYVIWFSNQVAFAATIAGAAGVTLTSAKSSIAASALGCLVLKKLTNAVPSFAYNAQGQQSGTFTTNGTYALYVL